MEGATSNGDDVRSRRLLIWFGFSVMTLCAAQLLRGLPLAQGIEASGGASHARLLCAYYAAWLLALVAVFLGVGCRRLTREVAYFVDRSLTVREAAFPLLAVCTAHLLRSLPEAADGEALVDSRAATARLVGAYAAWLVVLVVALAPVTGAPPTAVLSATLRSWVLRPILEGLARGATNNGDDVRSRRLLIWFGFSVMALSAAQLLRGLPLAQGIEASGGASHARLLCAYYAAWLLALVAVLLAVACRRLTRAVAYFVDRSLTVLAAPFPLLAVCTAHLLRCLAEAADREALVDSRAATARLVGAYAAWLLVFVVALAPVTGAPPTAVLSATLRSWVLRPILEGLARGATSNGDDVRSRRLLIWFGFSVMALSAAQLLRGLPLAQGTVASGGASHASLLCAYYAAWLLALVAVLLAVACRRLTRAVAYFVDRSLTVLAAPFPLLVVCTAHLLRCLAEAADRDALVDSRAAAASLVGAYAAWLLVLVVALAPVTGAPPTAVLSATLRSWVLRPILEGLARGATSNGDDVRSRRLLIWFGFSVMALSAAQLLRGLPLAQGTVANGGASHASLLCAYYAAWLLALVAVLLAVACRRLTRAVAYFVDRSLTVLAAPFPLLVVCTAHLLRCLAEATDRDALVDSRAAAASLVGAYAAWLLVLVVALAPVTGAPPTAVLSATLRSWVLRSILEGLARGATSNGDDGSSRRILIRVGFSAMALCAAQLLLGLPLAQGTVAGGPSYARLLCAYYAALLLALVTVLLAVAFRRFPRVVADVVNRALRVRAAPFLLLAFCTAHLFRSLVKAADQEALVDGRAAAAAAAEAAARFVGAYAAWLLVLIVALAPVAVVPPRAVPSSVTLMLLSAVILCLL